MNMWLRFMFIGQTRKAGCPSLEKKRKTQPPSFFCTEYKTHEIWLFHHLCFSYKLKTTNLTWGRASVTLILTGFAQVWSQDAAAAKCEFLFTHAVTDLLVLLRCTKTPDLQTTSDHEANHPIPHTHTNRPDKIQKASLFLTKNTDKIKITHNFKRRWPLMLA